MELQISCGPHSPDKGGALITGIVELADNTPPKPLERPATAMKTIEAEFEADIWAERKHF